MPYTREVRVVEERSDGICSLEWTVPDILSLDAEEGEYYESPTIDACGAEWILDMYPNGRGRDGEGVGWVNLELWRCKPFKNQSLHVTVGVKGLEGVRNRIEITREFSDDIGSYCWECNICSRSRLEEEASTWMPGGALTLAIQFRRVHLSTTDSSTQTAEQSIETEEEHQCSGKQAVEELQTSLHSLLRKEEECDVLLEVRGKEFRAHRLILGARSPVFRAMFAHDTLERQKGAVTVEDCSPETFPDLLEHIYTGSVRMVSEQNVFGLYSTGDKYDLGALREECSLFLRENVAVDTFCDTIALAVRHGEEELVRRATEFFCRHSLDIVRTVEWQKFLQENATVANELLIKLLSKHEKCFRDTE